MQKKKNYIDKKISNAKIQRPIIVLLTGNGKGKTSSALGMVLRSLGWGQKIVWVSFLKGAMLSGEKNFLKNNSNITYIEMPTGFTWDSQDKKLDKEYALNTWRQAEQYLNDETIDLIVFDEITYMFNYGYLDNNIINQIQASSNSKNIIITGRAANKSLKDIAHTISTVNNNKHAFESNIKAIKGIDF